MTTAASPRSTASAAAPWIAVREVMGPPAGRVPADAPLGAAVAELLRTRTDRLWVVAPAGAVVGVLTDVALTRAEIRGVPASTPAGELAAPVTPLHASADAAGALPRLGESGEPRVPVVDRGRLAGEITRADVLGLVHSVRRVAAVAGVPAEIEAPKPTTKAPRFLSKSRRQSVATPVPGVRPPRSAATP